MVCGQTISVFQSKQLLLGKSVQLFIQIQARYLVFRQVSRRLQESNIQSRKTIVVAGDTQPHQLYQCLWQGIALAGRQIKLVIGSE